MIASVTDIYITNKMEGGQSGTYLRQTKASSGPPVSVAKTYRDDMKRKLIFRQDHSDLPQQQNIGDSCILLLRKATVILPKY